MRSPTDAPASRGPARRAASARRPAAAVFSGTTTAVSVAAPHPRAAAIITLAAALAWAAVATAQSASEDAERVFTETLDVRVVNVEVVVTDRGGQRVRGLGREDFRLLVDGQTVPIDYFSEVWEGRVEPSGEVGPAGGDPPAAAPTTGTHYLLFVDEYFAIGAHRDLALEALARELALLSPADRMAVVAFPGRRLERLCTWKPPGEALAACLEQALARPTFGLHRASERARLDLTPARGGSSAVLEEIELEQVVRATVSAMRGVPRPPGRKVLLLLAGAWPTFENSSASIGLTIADSDLEILAELADTANLLGYTVYALDLPGLRTTGSDVTQEAPRAVGAPSPVTAEVIRQSGLRHLADRTGGRALLFGDRTRPLAAASEDTRSYYWLGFTPPRARDDESRPIRVELVPSGLKARTRRAFLDLSTDAEQEMLLESALLFGDGAWDLEIRAEPTARLPRRRQEVAIAVDVPVGRLTFLAGRDGFRAAAELRVAVIDADGKRSEIEVVPLDFSRATRPAAGATELYETRAVLRRRPHVLVATVFEPATGQAMAGRIEIEPGAPPPR